MQRAPSSCTRRRSSRSAVTTRHGRPCALRASSTIRSSPLPGASSTRTSGTEATPRAWPSTTRTISYGPGYGPSAGPPATASRSRNRSAAPRRSRHQPSGTDPTTLAPSTTSRGRRGRSSGFIAPGCQSNHQGPRLNDYSHVDEELPLVRRPRDGVAVPTYMGRAHDAGISAPWLIVSTCPLPAWGQPEAPAFEQVPLEVSGTLVPPEPPGQSAPRNEGPQVVVGLVAAWLGTHQSKAFLVDRAV